MATTTVPQLQMETPPFESLEEHPTESEKLLLEEEDNSGNKTSKNRHFQDDSHIDEDDEEDSDNESSEKLHFEDDSDIDEVEPLLQTYYQQVENTEGYGVTCRPKVIMYGRIVPVDDANNYRDMHLERIDQCVKYAIGRFNEQQGVAPLEYVDLVQATYYIHGGTTYYITFKAREAREPFKECKVYQTKVFRQKTAYGPLCIIVRQFRVKPEAGKQLEEYNLSPSEEEYKILMS
ncbi:hypothetical protein Tsubulata_030078 [Turnera subulata]|uniref:Cystatin domain-containing protein n=1 Tax=Turnera subulata TaxID=218843 RepID=A0A9Q0FQX3_9ROSI|nr:hypothetical protein Tsubulata_030078 [Turnera subulata]